MSKIYDLTGQRFGRLAVACRLDHRGGSTGKMILWSCLCDCGQKIEVSTGALNASRGGTRSCGCLYQDTRKSNGVVLGIARKKACGEASFNRLFDSYVRSAEFRGMDFSLSKEQFRQITSGNCIYCGVEPKQIFAHGKRHTNGHYLHNGIDRRNNQQGYILQNCFACCEICNKAKRHLSHEKFLSWIQRLIKHHE